MDSISDYFQGFDTSGLIFEALQKCIDGIGIYSLRVGKTQINFVHRISFATAWMPSRSPRTKAAPLALAISLRRPISSTRWKEMVEIYPGRWMHIIEFRQVDQIDDEVRAWLSEAWVSAM